MRKSNLVIMTRAETGILAPAPALTTSNLLREGHVMAEAKSTSSSGRTQTDLTGQRFNRLTVIGRLPGVWNRFAPWVCVCDCGNQKRARREALVRGSLKSCGCLRAERFDVGVFKSKRDITGVRFGRLVVIGRSTSKHPSGTYSWVCRCDCGKTKDYLRANLVRGCTKSCGCLHVERMAQWGSLVRKHGQSKTRLYRKWMGMKNRCNDPKNVVYADYGGRGIRVCERWTNSFPAFLEDMGVPPTPKHEIDRIDNNGNYEPGNCRWVTHVQNMQNTRASRFIEFNGRTMTLSEWAKEKGFSTSTLYSRLERGWTIAAAIETPLLKR